MNTKHSFQDRCTCIAELQGNLLKRGFKFLPITTDETCIPPLPALVSFSRIMNPDGRPVRTLVVTFNFCPFCGKQLRPLLERGKKNEG